MSDTPLRAPETAATSLALPAELTIYTVGETLPHWLAWLGQHAAQDGPAWVDGAALAEIDGAGLQMLVSLQQALVQRGRALVLRAPSAALQAACQGAGLPDLAPITAEVAP